jgi:penicillin-binding protein-related factor A (putative recombinase)
LYNIGDERQMSKTDYGKKFEEDFQKSFSSLVDVSIDRVYDVMSGFKGHATFCDFKVYRFPNMFYFELKSVDGDYFPLKNLTNRQFEGLLNKSHIKGVHAGVIINFRLTQTLHRTYFIPIHYILKLKGQDRKAITTSDAIAVGKPLVGTLKRTRFIYDIEPFLDEITEVKER